GPAPGGARHRQPAHRRHPGRRHRPPAPGPGRGGGAGGAGPGDSGGGCGSAGPWRGPARLRVHRGQRARRPGQPRTAAHRRTFHRSAVSAEPGSGLNAVTGGKIMSHQLPEPDVPYLRQVLLEMLAIPSPTGLTDTIVRYGAERRDEMDIPYGLTRRRAARATLQRRPHSPDRAVSAHLDTIAASVREIKDNGRLCLAPIGCWSSRFAEGSRVSLFTDNGVLRGSVLPLLASGHAFNTEVDSLPVSWEHIELRLDVLADSRAEVEALGVRIGDVVAFDPLPEFSESGHPSARHLDDKAGVAALLTVLKIVVDSGLEPPIDWHPAFTITEEIGSGAAAALPWDVSEFVGVDIAPVAPGQSSSEHAV